jgi:hypothetical protein
MRALEALFDETEDPTERFKRLSLLLDDWPDLHHGVRLMRQQTGEQLYENAGMTYEAIGALIGVTESRARHIVKGITNPSRQKRKAEKEAAERAQLEGRGDTGAG